MPLLEREIPPVIGQSRAAVKRAQQLSAWHSTILERCRTNVVTALEAVETSWSLWDDASAPPVHCRFYLRASVDGEPRLAIWRTNRLLVHPELEKRGRILITLGETFEAPELGSIVPAGFNDPLQAALTLIRAADRVFEFDLRLEELTIRYRAETPES